MDYKKVEELFFDYILSILGPNSSTEELRNNYLDKIKQIITDILVIKLPDYNTHVITYGSFPAKSYLKSADIDITILIESKKGKNIMTNLPRNVIDGAFSILKEELERKSKEPGSEFITDIEIIKADIRLLKFKVGKEDINIDLTINNFAALYKIIFINFIEEQFKHRFHLLKYFEDSSYSENKRNIFRRIFLLIKGWCYYEGKILGSNMSLMATYTLEILVIYVLNFYYDEIHNEFEGFIKFFEIMDKFNFEKEIISLFGIIPKLNFYEKLKNYNINIQKEAAKSNKIIINKPFWYLEEDESIKEDSNTNIINKDKKVLLLDINDIKNFIYHLNKGIEFTYLRNEGKEILSINFEKNINILDPLNNNNNLGKSISFHNVSRIKSVILLMVKKLKLVLEMRENSNPFIYMNALFNLFKDTLSTMDLELFGKFLTIPQLKANSKLYKKFIKNKEETKLLVDIKDINKFNSLFSKDVIFTEASLIKEDEDDDEYEEEKEENKEKPENEEEEDEDPYEEDIIINDEEKETSEDSDIHYFLDIKEKFNFEYIINKEIIKKLFELQTDKQNSIKSNNHFIMKSKENAMEIEKFIQEHDLI